MWKTQGTVNSPDLRKIGIHPDFWYPLTQSKALKTGKPLAVRFAGEPIVLVRTESGKVFALEDRCAHRQVPLSLGVVQGERLKCCYHAWQYEESGRVASVPYLPKGARAPRGVRSYPCREAYGHIFVFPGNPEKAKEVPFLDLPTFHSPAHKTMAFSRQIHCHYSFMHENLLDMNHQFLHRRLMGSINATPLGEHQKGQNWIEVKYKFERAGGKQHRGANFLLGGKDSDPNARSYDIMTIRTEYPYQYLNVCRPNSTEPAFNLWAVYVPVDREQRIHHSYGLLMIRKPKISALMTLFWPIMRYFTNSVFLEDQMAVEAEQKAHDMQGDDWNQEVFPLILDLRAMLTQNGIPLTFDSLAPETRKAS